jgi:hypothetical protein
MPKGSSTAKAASTFRTTGSRPTAWRKRMGRYLRRPYDPPRRSAGAVKVLYGWTLMALISCYQTYTWTPRSRCCTCTCLRCSKHGHAHMIKDSTGVLDLQLSPTHQQGQGEDSGQRRYSTPASKRLVAAKSWKTVAHSMKRRTKTQC